MTEDKSRRESKFCNRDKFCNEDFNEDKESTNMELDREATGLAGNDALAAVIAQLAAAGRLDETAARLGARLDAQASGAAGMSGEAVGGEVAKVVAAIDSEPFTRLAELEGKLQAAERKIAELCAQAQTPAAVASGRKTLPAAAAHLLAKHGIDTLEQVHGGALDSALTGLSLEQRIAVKSQLMRAGLLG